MQEYITKVETLVEAFPYIQSFHKKTIVIKYGGNAMIDENLKKSFAQDIVLMKYVGINPIIVHGGGPQIGSLLKKVGKQSEFIDGLRITDNETMDFVEMVLVGHVNKEIINNINYFSGKAVGLSGKDARLLKAHKIYHQSSGKQVDIGQVGDIEEVNTAILESIYKQGFIPVIAPTGFDDQGNTYNINADTVAGKIAEALNAEKLVLLTDIEGVKIKQELVSSIKKDKIPDLIEEGEINGGMIPKVNCCVEALDGGVEKAHIIDGRKEHAILLELFTDAGIGTEIVK